MARLPMKVRRPFLSAADRIAEELQIVDERRLLQQVRAGREICWDDEPEPLVTVRIATYGTGDLVVRRAIASALAQTYERLEILVVGDNCDADTVEAVNAVRDPRVRFVNLPTRGLYPDIAHLRRKVAGAHPMTMGNILANGAWIAPCDDDDSITPDHVEVLLAALRRGPYEMVYSKAQDEGAPDDWGIVGTGEFEKGKISHGSVMFSSGLSFMPYSMTCWKRREPSDWNLWNRMERIGVRIGYEDAVTYVHHLSNAGRTQLDTETTA